MIKLLSKEIEVLENFYYQTGNGGFDQFISNGYADDSDKNTLLVEALKKIGSNKIAKALEDVAITMNHICECSHCWDGHENDGCPADEDGYADCFGCEEEEGETFSLFADEELYMKDFTHDFINDYELYKMEEYRAIEKALKENEGFVSETGSIILDAIKGK